LKLNPCGFLRALRTQQVAGRGLDASHLRLMRWCT